MRVYCEAQDRRGEPMTLSASTRGHESATGVLPIVLVAGVLAAASPVLRAQPSPVTQLDQLKQLSIEQLTHVEVTSVTRGSQPLSQSAAAVAVVTGGEIARAGAMNIPEAIRYVPGIDVAQVTAGEWAVSSRGFASVTSPDLLVLSDGRSIYTPLFSGVFWDVQDYLMQDIDRIEVVRGPGAALWGSNAVNGVINIVSKSAKETQGAWMEAGTGSEEQALVAGQYGGEAAGDAYYRVFAKYQSHAAEDHPPGSSPDGWDLGHVGFRTDWQADSDDALTIQGDAYDGSIGEVSPAVSVIGRPGPAGLLRVGVSGGNVLGHWRHTMSSDSDFEVRLYYDYTRRNDPTYLDELGTLDLDFQEHLPLGGAQQITWGLSGRTMDDHNLGKGVFALNPPDSRDNLASGFVQDEISLPHSVRVTLGTKLEHNDFSGFEMQPSVRAAWSLSSTQTIWGAVSRAVRVPTRIERDVDIAATDPAGNPVIVLLGNRSFHAEQVLAFEIGLSLAAARQRVARCHGVPQPLHRARLSGARHPVPRCGDWPDRLPASRPRTSSTGIPPASRAWRSMSPVDWWRLSLDYSYIDMRLTPLGQDLNRERYYAGSTPRNQVGVQSWLDLPHRIELYGGLRAASAVRSLPEIVNGTGDAALPGARLECDLARHGAAHHIAAGPQPPSRQPRRVRRPR